MVIDKDGYADPELQEFHLRELRREKGMLLSTTRKQAIIAAAWLTASFALAYQVIPLYLK